MTQLQAHNFKDMTGMKIGRLFVLKFEEIRNSKAYWLCQCDCGITKVVCGNSLRSALVKSCGCLTDEIRHRRRKGE